MVSLLLDRVSKSYGATQALADFSLEVAGGDVVALVGENGAGKSTLAKLLAGVEAPDSGTILLDGRPLRLGSPRDAMRHGIGFLPQELAPFPSLTLAENLFVGDWPAISGPGMLGIITRRGILAAARAELASLGFHDIDVTREASTATLAELQLIEIARAVRRRSLVIVFDEPTAALNSAETETLHRIIRTLSGRGVAVIYVSHRMDEVFAFSRRICVLRNGRKVREHETSAVSHDTIVEEMVGRRIEPGRGAARGDPSASAALLALEDASRPGRPALASVSLTLRKGEIVGLYGLRGSGAETIGALIGGHVPASGGRFAVEGREAPLPRHPRAAHRLGIRYIPASRKTEGLVLGLSVADNISLPDLGRLSRAGVILRGRQREIVDSLVRHLRIRLRGTSQRVSELSGGNQQKVLLASRFVEPNPKILVLQEPTRGVDIGARADIHETLRGLAAEGTGILFYSSDVDETVAIADRVLVVRDGRIAAALAGPDKTTAKAVAAAANPRPAMTAEQSA